MVANYFVIFFSAICGLVNGANILALMGVASPSHHIWNSVIMNELGNRGHNVTVVSPDAPKISDKVSKNVHYIHLDDVYSYLYDGYSDEPLNISSYIKAGIFDGTFALYDFCYKNAEAVLKSKGQKTIMNYPDTFKFDLVVHDYTCGSFLLWYLHKFNYPPLVGVTAFLNPPSTMDMVGGHKYPAYVPYFSLPYGVNMNFIERVTNTAVFILDHWYRRYVHIPRLDALIRSHFQIDMPYLGELEQRTTIALVNSHPAVNYPEVLPPNVIEIGGVQILDPKPLPKDMEDFISNSQKGAIFFSLGTNVKSKDLGPERCKIILDVMAQMPEYNFLWKSDIDVKEYKIPKNVLIKTFFPQRDILAHKKIKAFVTHSGGLSTQESIWRDVPMIGLPLFADQHGNIDRALRLGIAEKISYSDLSVDILRNTIRKVAGNPSYAENMRLYSARYKDRPMKALDTAVWWIEYVLRNPHPEHLRSPVLDIGFIRANSLDLLFIVILLLSVLVWFLFSIFKVCFCKEKNILKKSVKIEKKVKYN